MIFDFSNIKIEENNIYYETFIIYDKLDADYESFIGKFGSSIYTTKSPMKLTLNSFRTIFRYALENNIDFNIETNTDREEQLLKNEIKYIKETIKKHVYKVTILPNIRHHVAIAYDTKEVYSLLITNRILREAEECLIELMDTKESQILV